MTKKETHGVLDGLASLLVPIDELTPDPKNARKHDDRNLGSIRESLERYGQHHPLVVQKEGRIVRVGNGRLAAAKALGWTHIAALIVDEDDVQATARAIADNRSGDLAEWDFKALDETLADLEKSGIKLDTVGFDKIDFPEFSPPAGFEFTAGASLGEDNPPKIAEEVEELDDSAEPTTQRGDVWTLGDHRLVCGDSFEKDDRAKLLGGERVDVVVTDPPYAIYGSSSGISSSIADDKMVRPFFEQLGRALFDSMREFACLFCFTDWRSWAALWYGFNSAGLAPKNCVVWTKAGAGLGNTYSMTHEFVGFFMRLPPQKSMVSGRKAGIRQILRPNVKNFNRVAGDEREHNAQKPVDLVGEFLEEGSDPGATVLDLFGGSGSTLIAAERTGRAARLMEIEPAWCDKIVARWERETGKKAKREAAK